MSLPVAVRTTANPGSYTAEPRRRPRRIAWWRPLVVVRGYVARALRYLWRRIGARPRFWLKIGAALVVLTAPIWTLNMAVSFFGRTAVFPMSPYFLRQKLAALGLYARHWVTCSPRDHESVDDLVKAAEIRHHLPRALLAAVIHVESNGYAHRISSAGAMGPGQLMPDTAKLLGVSDPYNTGQNVDGAARLLADHMRRFHRVRLAIAAYHAGPGAIRGHQVPDNGMTPGYVSRVIDAYRKLRPKHAKTA
jgi:hypothetical protein